MTSEVMSVTESAELADFVQDNRVVILNFSGLSWCVPCQRLWPWYEKYAREYGVDDVVFLHADTENADALVEQFGVLSVPYVVAISGVDITELPRTPGELRSAVVELTSA